MLLLLLDDDEVTVEELELEVLTVLDVTEVPLTIVGPVLYYSNGLLSLSNGPLDSDELPCLYYSNGLLFLSNGPLDST